MVDFDAGERLRASGGMGFIGSRLACPRERIARAAPSAR